MIEIKPISGFDEKLPEEQITEDNFKDIIRKNYSLSGFVPVETLSVERVETLTSKGGDDNEIYGVQRLKAESGDVVELGLRFDLTVPFARYVAQNEGVLSFPFKRQQIQKVWRGERPQKCRYREFYQADIDVVGNGTLPLFADVEIVSTIYNALKELNFGDFVMHMNSKKILVGFLESLEIQDVVKVMGVIDKKDKVKDISVLLDDAGVEKVGQKAILKLIEVSKKLSNIEIFEYFSDIENTTLQEGLKDLYYVYNNLLALGVDKENIKIDPSISRGLNYYTGTVFETFITGFEKFGSVSSGGRYDDLCSNFTKNNYPGVGGSIGVSRLLCILEDIGKIENNQKVPTKVLVLNMGKELLTDNLFIVQTLRSAGIPTEIYLDENTKIQKQLKYADNKKIPLVVICGDDEKLKGVVQLKNLNSGKQDEIGIHELVDFVITK